MMWLIIAGVSAFISGLLFGYAIKDDGVFEDRFDMTGFKEKEHLVSIAPYEGTR